MKHIVSGENIIIIIIYCLKGELRYPIFNLIESVAVYLVGRGEKMKCVKIGFVFSFAIERENSHPLFTHYGYEKQRNVSTSKTSIQK